ncbi:fluoride efflux transporter CrcB [Mycetocola zhujimingii]|uniref:Fluoride-specific ion channel FluC n=2 Tax=Mycetocola zhujimingii TaxID=2079792 RepID=A0A2U1TCR0_9MICO|nr:fluoride efflux transporter CrcB [Mycetocola zhujimingii]PWC06675.1 fluoride efflux transporter CrcB [Mycetocola zhujimingii]
MAVRPEHLKWAPIGLVFIGGAFGAATREWLSLVIPKLGEVPISIAIINVIGAFLLGYLYEAVTRLDSAKPTGKNLKLLLGTGYCGGFTTYSSLATDTGVLFRDGFPVEAIIYSLATVIVGACATWLGIVIASAVNRARGPETPQSTDSSRKAS